MFKTKPTVVPPHANAKAHEKVMRWLRTASSAEVMTASVRAGIYRPDGRLTKEHGGR